MNEIDLEAKDRRKTNRQRLRLQALIKIDDQTSIACETRNISDTGALLAVNNATRVPDQFELSIPEAFFQKIVKVVWRRTRSVGVRF